MKRLGTVVILLLALSLNAIAEKKAVPDVKGKESGEMIEVIVQFVDHALEKKERTVEEAFTKAGGKRVGDLNLIGAEIYLVPAKAVEELLKTPNIRHVSPNRGIKPKRDSSDPPV